MRNILTLEDEEIYLGLSAAHFDGHPEMEANDFAVMQLREWTRFHAKKANITIPPSVS